LAISPADEPLQNRLLAEYYTQRIKLVPPPTNAFLGVDDKSWLQNQVHLADYMYASLHKVPLPAAKNHKLLLQIGETLFDVGTDLLRKKSLDGAIKYLRWSWDYVLQISRGEGAGVEGRELSVNVRHNLAKSLVRRGEVLDLDSAREFIDGLALVRVPLDGG
jgi:hypothetical protein